MKLSEMKRMTSFKPEYRVGIKSYHYNYLKMINTIEFPPSVAAEMAETVMYPESFRTAITYLTSLTPLERFLVGVTPEDNDEN